MKSNYNDIIDIILTFINEPYLKENLIFGGSIVPYLIAGKESNNDILDFYILVNGKKIKSIRKKIEKLTETYLFDIISDSSNLTSKDYGFKIKYEDISLGLFPYYINDNNFIIKTYSYDEKKKKVSLKTKLIPNLSSNMVIKKTKLDNKNILVLLPEFILVEKQLSNNYDSNDDSNVLLETICDDEITEFIRKDVEKSEIKVISKEIKKKNLFLNILLFLILVIIILIAYICFKK